VVVVPAKVYENVDPTLVMMKTPFVLVPHPERSVQLVTVAVEDGLVGPSPPPQATPMIASVATRTGQSCVANWFSCPFCFIALRRPHCNCRSWWLAPGTMYCRCSWP
jgi:hypothetical protein